MSQWKNIIDWFVKCVLFLYIANIAIYFENICILDSMYQTFCLGKWNRQYVYLGIFFINLWRESLVPVWMSKSTLYFSRQYQATRDLEHCQHLRHLPHNCFDLNNCKLFSQYLNFKKMKSCTSYAEFCVWLIFVKFLHMCTAEFHSFFLLFSFPLHGYTIIYLSILLVDCVVSILGSY